MRGLRVLVEFFATRKRLSHHRLLVLLPLCVTQKPLQLPLFYFLPFSLQRFGTNRQKFLKSYSPIAALSVCDQDQSY